MARSKFVSESEKEKIEFLFEQGATVEDACHLQGVLVTFKDKVKKKCNNIVSRAFVDGRPRVSRCYYLSLKKCNSIVSRAFVDGCPRVSRCYYFRVKKM